MFAIDEVEEEDEHFLFQSSYDIPLRAALSCLQQRSSLRHGLTGTLPVREILAPIKKKI